MTFSQLIGNETAKAALLRMLEYHIVPHTLLFCGPDGIGKRLYAQRIAEVLMGSAAHFKLLKGNHPDLHQLYPEGKASLHPIENIRAMIKEAGYPPFESLVKIFIIHDAHQMLPSSSNALLKILEEPVEHTYFILITSQPESILPTIISRSCKIAFFPISEREITCFAKEYWQKDDKDAKRIAFLSQGSLAKAQVLARQTKEEGLAIQALAYAFVTLSLPKEHARLLALCDELERRFTSSDEEIGQENISMQIDNFLEEVFAWYRDLYVLKNNIASEHLYHLDAAEHLKTDAQKAIPVLEDVLNKIFTVRSALQRHVRLRVALEQFFLALVGKN